MKADERSVKYNLNHFGPTIRIFLDRGSIGANSLLSFSSLTVQFFSNMILVMILARLVNVGTLGEILYAIVFSNIVVVLVSYGFDNLVIREISKGRYGIAQIASNLLFAKLLLSLPLLGLIFVVIQGLSIPLTQPGNLWFYIGAALINSFVDSTTAIRKGKNDFATEMKVSLFLNGLFFVGVLAAASMWDVTTQLIGQVRLASRILALAFAMFLFVKKLEKEERKAFRWSFTPATVKELFVVGLPFALQAILGTAYFQVDSLVLGALKRSTEVGYYQASMQIVSGVMLIPIAVIQAYYPKLASSFSSSYSGGRALMATMMRMLAVLGFCLTLFFGLGASPLIQILYGPGMYPTITVMRILSLVFLIRSIAGGLGISLIAVDLQKVPSLASFVALMGSLIMNLLLIPRGGFVAVAWVNLFINLTILGIYALWWKRISCNSVNWKN